MAALGLLVIVAWIVFVTVLVGLVLHHDHRGSL